LKTNDPIRIFISHDDVMDDVTTARTVRNLLWNHFQARHIPAEIRLGEDLAIGENWAIKLRKYMRTVDVVAVLLTKRSIESPMVLQQVGMAFALEKPILPIVSHRDILNRFTIALRTDRALGLGDINTPNGKERFATAFESAIEIAHAA